MYSYGGVKLQRGLSRYFDVKASNVFSVAMGLYIFLLLEATFTIFDTFNVAFQNLSS